MKLNWKLGLAGAALAASVAFAVAQTIAVPRVQSIGPNDLIQIIPNGQPSAQSVYAPTPLLGEYGQTLAGGATENALIGGDFTTNLFQRGTSVGSITTTATYTADRWIAWSGTATTLTVTQQTAAADRPAGFGASLRVNKSAGAGVVQSCVAQAMETSASFQFAGQTAEFSFYAKAGSTFSAASSNVAVYIATGTGTNETAAAMAFGINAGGGAGAGWTGQSNLGGAGGYLIPINTGWNRYAVVAPVPAAATQIGVTICYTPVGTGSATDWFEFTGAQLTKNPALTTVAGAAGAALQPNDLRMKAFFRRPQQQETALQQRYFVAITEPAASVSVAPSGQGASTTTCILSIPLPVTMRVAPTFAAAGTALSASTWTITHVVSNTALATPFLAATAGGSTNTMLNLTATTSTLTAGQTCTLTGAAGGSILQASAEL